MAFPSREAVRKIDPYKPFRVSAFSDGLCVEAVCNWSILADCQQTENVYIFFFILLFDYHVILLLWCKEFIDFKLFRFTLFEQKGRLKTESCFQTALILFQYVIRDAFAGTESRRGWFANWSATLQAVDTDAAAAGRR